jgi:Tol biopolymer transport system component
MSNISRRELLFKRLPTTVIVAGLSNTPSVELLKPQRFIGYTEYRTNLPGGRHVNNITMRACVVGEDGRGRKQLAPDLVKEPNTWTQFAGWSPDGKQAVIGSGWESPENAAWEEEHKTFRFNDGWKYDVHLLDLKSGKNTNMTAIERVSNYNSGLFFWPGDPNRLGFTALINGDSHPYSMDRDGRNKKDLTEGSKEFAYGFTASPEGKRISYHKSYQIYLADADGSNARKIETGNSFNFAPTWSSDGEWVMFVSGEHYNCHPYVVRRDGTGLKKIADRQGYRGVVEFLDVPDFHGGSSDVPIWSPDGQWVYYTAKFGDSIELMRTKLDGTPERLTNSDRPTLHYHPIFSRDGKKLLFGSNRSGARQLHTMNPDGKDARQITHVQPGYGAMWGHWQPAN